MPVIGSAEEYNTGYGSRWAVLTDEIELVIESFDLFADETLVDITLVDTDDIGGTMVQLVGEVICFKVSISKNVFVLRENDFFFFWDLIGGEFLNFFKAPKLNGEGMSLFGIFQFIAGDVDWWRWKQEIVLGGSRECLEIGVSLLQNDIAIAWSIDVLLTMEGLLVIWHMEGIGWNVLQNKVSSD